MLYFDHNATSPLCDAARKVWLDAVERFPGNPSSPHRVGTRAETALEGARETVAAALGCDASELVWTSGATEANNALAHHYAASGIGEAWVSAIEHPSMLAAVRRHFEGRFRLIPVDRSGVADLNWLSDELKTRRPAFVALMAANNETGVLQPWQEALALCREAGVEMVCDAVQWIGRLPAGGLGACAAVIGCGHKFGGPQGVGFMKCPARMRPLLVGGKQEDGRRAGTENVAGALATAAALEERECRLRAGEAALAEAVRDRFLTALEECVPGVQLVGAGRLRLWNTVSVSLPLPDCRLRWVVKLDRLGVAVSTGSACSSGREQASHVLTAMGLAPEDAAKVVRISSGWETRPEDWDALLARIASVWNDVVAPQARA